MSSSSSNQIPTKKCANCGAQKQTSLKLCTGCRLVYYCDRDCQIIHRVVHRRKCNEAQQQKQQQETQTKTTSHANAAEEHSSSEESE